MAEWEAVWTMDVYKSTSGTLFSLLYGLFQL